MEISSQTIKAPDDSISVSGSEKQSVESNFHEVEIFIFVRRDERFHFLMKDGRRILEKDGLSLPRTRRRSTRNSVEVKDFVSVKYRYSILDIYMYVYI